jgi:inosine-uridine nucleoside N-ribohydrolase
LLVELKYDVRVIQGSGGKPTDYEDIVSSRAAREYCHEIKTDLDYTSDDLKKAIHDVLTKNNNVEFILLAPPTDLIKVLDENPALKSNIRHIHVMGGYITKNDNRTTYNWNMDSIASAKLVAMSDVNMTLYSSHVIKAAFQGGSINRGNYPELIKRIDTLIEKVPALQSHRLACANWNRHLIQKIPALANIIGPYSDHQFTPADPIIIASIVCPEINQRQKPVILNIDLNEKDSSSGYKIIIADNADSKINLVEQIDVAKFIGVLNKVLDLI